MNYAVYNPAIGYSQGMSDLVAPLLAEVLDESDTFWCFVGLMQNTIFVSSPRDEDMERQLVRLRHVWPRKSQGGALPVGSRGLGSGPLGRAQAAPRPPDAASPQPPPAGERRGCAGPPLPASPPAHCVPAPLPRSEDGPTTPGLELEKAGPQVHLGCSLPGFLRGDREGGS